jgi:hypothetical protein
MWIEFGGAPSDHEAVLPPTSFHMKFFVAPKTEVILSFYATGCCLPDPFRAGRVPSNRIAKQGGRLVCSFFRGRGRLDEEPGRELTAKLRL